MAELTATASCTACRAVIEASGELVGQRQLAERVGWMAALAQRLAGSIVTAHWTDGDLDALAAGVDAAGRHLPSKGWMALRRLGWTASVAEGGSVSDRVCRTAEEPAARTLRLALHRRVIGKAILAAWPKDPGKRTDAAWATMRALLPVGTTNTEVRSRTRQIRSRTRQIRAWAAGHDGRLPDVLTELEPPPHSPAQLLLAAADKQLTTLARADEQRARLRVRLPLVAAPATTADWAWHGIDLRLPPTVPADAGLAAPTVRVVDRAVRVDVPFTQPIPTSRPDGHVVGLGLDWGVNTLLTGSIGRLATIGGRLRVASDGRRLRFDATPITAKLQRLRRNRETVAARRDHYTRLLATLAATGPQATILQRKQQILDAEHEYLCNRIRRRNRNLAWVAARWATDPALALGATVIDLEDLATLEARGRRGAANARLSGQVRGTIVGAVRHLAAKAGVAVVTVPARGTSKGCPRCRGVLSHAPAPDRANQRGWKWAGCPRCGLSCDRDHAAAERIVARGLLAQPHTVTDRKTGARTIRTTVDGPVARARRPRRQTRSVRRRQRRPATRSRPPTMTAGTHSPTPARPPAQPKRTAATPKTSRCAPDRRAVPGPVATLAAGKRPAGPVPQTRRRLRVAAVSGPAHDRLHRPGRIRSGAAWGFHRRVHATEVVLLSDFSPRIPTATPHPECQDHIGNCR
jgi:Putative transposase DNA-binding domain